MYVCMYVCMYKLGYRVTNPSTVNTEATDHRGIQTFSKLLIYNWKDLRRQKAIFFCVMTSWMHIL